MSVTLHTTHGDIKCQIYCEEVPKTAKNFLALCAKGYYNGTLFHRNISGNIYIYIYIGFIIQGGDPTGSGKGGESIYGKNFEDEIREDLQHERRGTLSMANSGPNTNNSQFFFAYEKHVHLDGIYTIFGRIIDGLQTLDQMEKEPVGKAHRPLNEIKLINITLHANPIADNES